MYLVRDGRSIRTRGQVTTSGPGMTLILPLVMPLLLVYPGLAGFGRNDHRHAGRRRLLSLESRAFGDFWGFLAGWWNWYCLVFAGQRLMPCSSPTTWVLFPATRGMETLPRFPRHGRADHLHQRSRHSDGRQSCHRAWKSSFCCPMLVLVVIGLVTVASQSICSGDPAASATVHKSSAWAWRWGLWLYSGYEQLLDGSRRSRQSAAQLSAGACAGRAACRSRLTFCRRWPRSRRSAIGNSWHTGYLSHGSRSSSEDAGWAPG